nr:non-ribosomal peptide synthetase [uncultured Flavobacterium sp.]
MQTLLKKLNKSNIKIDLVDEKLDIQAPKGVMTADLLNEIKLHKNDLIEFITLYKTKKEKYLFIPQVPIQSSYVLSSSQRRLWLLSQFEGGNSAYNMPSVFELKGDLAVSSLESAFEFLIERHESLRTLFKEEESGEVKQLILNLKDVRFKLQYADVSNEENLLEITKEMIQKEIEYSFDLSSDSLLRAKLVKTSQDTYVFICVMHHVISDGQSAEVMTNELFTLYDKHLKGNQSSLPVLQLQYKDYATWQQGQLLNGGIEDHKSYWLQQFKGELPILDLPTYKTRPAIKTYNGKSVNKVYSENLLKDFSDLCQSQGSTLFMGLLATVKVLLYRYTNQNDIVIGSPIAGREHADLNNQIGLYVNTLALRTQFDGEISFKELLANVKQVTLDAYEHQIYPFDELVEQLPLKRDMSRNPLFDVMVTLQNANNLKVNIQSIGAIDIKEYQAEETVSKFDLGFTFGVSDKGLGVTLAYNTDLYSEEFAQRILNHLEVIMASVIMQSNVSVNALNYLTDAERHQLLVAFNNTKVDYTKDKTIVDLFEDQVSKTPENIAILFEDVKLTYAELNAKANQLAHFLKEQGVQAGSNIVLCFDSHLEMAIVGIIGILKLGAVYVPIDPDYPQDRINYIIKNSEAKFIITNSIDTPLFNDKTVRTILLDKENLDCNSETIKNIEKNSANQDSAYVIYTSGTTGIPKGVLVNHQNIMDYLFGLSKKIKIEDNQSFALMSTVSTDLGNTVLFSSLIFGGVIHLFSKNMLRDIYYIQQYFTNNEIDCIKIVPSYWKSLEIDGKLISPSRMIIFGGEELSNEIVSRIKSENPKLKIINHYGPTETTIGKLLHEVNPNYNYNRIPIGKAFSNTQLYVVDRNLSLCAIGIIGELLIGGDGVSNGYLNNLKLSEEKFIENVFQNDGRKLYRTGDLVVMHPDGNIEFRGRIDNQVKILGHRIELNEIENAINKFEGIKSSVANVIETDNGNKRIVAYIVCNKEELPHNEILDHLRLLLPSIMIPSILIKIDEIPFTSNGKINHKALPSISGEDVLRSEYVAPTTDAQTKLVEIWQEVLGVQKIGVTDNFFELGGHSLIVAQVINRTYKELSKSISFRDFFANPTVEGLSKKLKETDYSPIPKAAEAISYPLTSTQNRLWILSQLEGGSVAYNMPVTLRIKENINYHLFQKSFDNLIQRHEILRTYFKINEQGEIRQHVVPFEAVNFVIDHVDFINKSNTEKELENYLQSLNDKAFNLEQFPLIRASLIKITDEEHVFFFSRHHIIGDGWSSQIIISEVVKTYNALVQGKEINLPELHIQYKDYAVWFNEELQQEKHQASEQYWLQQFSGELPVLDLPSFKIRPLVQTYNGDSFTHTFSKAFLEKLKTFSKEHDVTLFMSLMAGINSLLHRYTGQDDIIIGTPIAGREHPDLENQLGLYLNTLAIRTQFKEKDSFLDLIAVQKGSLLGAYEHQSYPFDGLVEKLNLKRDTSRSALFDVMVVLQNQGQLNNLNNEGQLSGLKVEEYDFRRKTSQFDISFTFAETEGLDLTIEYNTDIYNDYLIRRMFSHFENLVTELLQQPKKNIQEVNYLTESEKHELIVGFNNTEQVYPKDKTIIDLFEEQVAKTPNNLAVIFEEVKLTYKELNEKSNQLGAYLRENYSIKSDDLIGIKLDRTEMLIITILGILKSGGAYVPIDSTYPQARIDYIEKDINSVIVIDHEVLESFNTIQGKYLKSNIKKINKPSDLAYVIYTSGTTGNPKGVMVEHKNVIRLVKPSSFFPLNEEKILLSTGSISFDATIIEYFGTLLNGSKLILTKQENLLELEALRKVIQENSVNSLWMTASWFNQVVENKIDVFETINQLIVGGDIVSPIHIAKVFENYPTIKIVNGYGPTENTTFSTTFEIKNQKYFKIPIGSPIPNSSGYILDKGLKAVPVGVVGKIYVSGAGVARGYLNQSELTKEKFIGNPFIEGERMYDTGDLGCWLPDGNIEFFGRKDHQIKIRGFRIEPDEIENTILLYSKDLKQVVVEAKEVNQEKVLVAYLVSKEIISKSELRSFLQERLPDYMIPSFYVTLEELPLTLNGKIDTNALPSISSDDIIRKEYLAPRNDIEKKLVSIWQEVLGIGKVGITDNFFELGGNSISIMKIINKSKTNLNVDIQAIDILKNQTVDLLANFVIKFGQANYNKRIKKVLSKENNYPLTPQQYSMWVASNIGNSKAYNIPVKVNLKGNLDIKGVEYSIRKIVERHDSLRTVFKLDDQKKPYQYIKNVEEFEFTFDYRETLDGLREILISEFDLIEGPLFRAGIIKKGEDLYTCYFVFHHIITDGWSMVVFEREIRNYYLNYLNNITEVEDVLPIQYKDYAHWINENYDEKFKNNEQYWIEKLNNKTELIFPFEKRLNKISYKGNKKSLIINKILSEEIDAFCRKNLVTSLSFFITALNILLYKYSGKKYFISGIPYAGRINPDLMNQIGLYISTVPIDYEIKLSNSVLDNIKKQNIKSVEALDYQIVDLNKILHDVKYKSSINKHPLFDYIFAFQNQFDELGENEWDRFSENTNINFIGEEEEEINLEHSQVNLGFSIHNTKKQYKVFITYFIDLYRENEINGLLKDYQTTIKYILKNSELRVDELIEKIKKENGFFQFEPFENTEIETFFTFNKTEDNHIVNDIKSIFRSILNLDNIDQEDDFFQIGGNSILAIQLVNEINEYFNTQLLIIDFYMNSSVIKLYKLMAAGKLNDNNMPLIEFHHYSKNLPILVLFPPILGSSLIYKKLADNLSDKYNCIGINIPLIKNVNSSIEEISKMIFDEIIKLYGMKNDIHLLGYSVGVNLAFEVAKLLEKSNKEVNLFLIDRGPIDLFDYDFKDIDIDLTIKKIISDNLPMIDYTNEAFDLNYHQLIIKQMLISLKDYRVTGKLEKTKIFSFESKYNNVKGYMANWKNHTILNHLVIDLDGNHLEALNKNNLNIICNCIVNEKESVYK